ncbi:MAG: VWA domain-containing protein [Acidobacteriota bacterium]
MLRFNRRAWLIALALSLTASALLPIISATVPLGADRQANAQDRDDVVRVSTDLVVLNVTVLDKNGKFVTGLKNGDFQISEDGVEQKIAAFSAEETPFAAAILLDTSGSMETRLTLGRSAAIRFLDGLREQDVASIYSFHTKVEQWGDYSPGRDLPPRVYGLKTKTWTALNDAVVRAADDLAKREEKRRAIVVLSDGGENYSSASADKALDRASLAAATIYGVNMSEQGPKRDIVGAGTLRNLAEKSGGRYIDTPGGLQLRDSFAAIAEELGHQYTISYRPSNRARDGKWRKVDVKLTKPDVTVRTRKGYRAPKG